MIACAIRTQGIQLACFFLIDIQFYFHHHYINIGRINRVTSFLQQYAMHDVPSALRLNFS